MDDGAEEWRRIVGWDTYEVSDHGRIRHYWGGLRRIDWWSGRARILLSEHGRRQTYLVHRLVCEMFNGEPPPGREYALHADRNIHNNRADNLFWGTRDEAARLRWHLRKSGQRSGTGLSTRSATGGELDTRQDMS